MPLILTRENALDSKRSYASGLLTAWGVSVILIGLLSACAGTKERGPMSSREKARTLVEVANGALSEGDPTGALTALVSAEALDDSLPELYHSRALAFIAKKNTQAALENAQKAVTIFPNYSDACTTLGKLLLDQGRFSEAETYLKRAATDSLYRDAYRAQTSLGILYYRQSKWTLAQKELDSAIDSEPEQSCVAFYYRGHLRMKDSNMASAIRDYSRATQRLCGGFGDAHYALGVALAKNRQYSEARKKFIEIRDRYPDSALATQAMEGLKYLP